MISQDVFYAAAAGLYSSAMISGDVLPWALMAITRSRIGWAWAKNALRPGHSQYWPGCPSALRPKRSLGQPPLQKRR